MLSCGDREPPKVLYMRSISPIPIAKGALFVLYMFCSFSLLGQEYASVATNIPRTYRHYYGAFSL
jgi:hypothetical protein